MRDENLPVRGAYIRFRRGQNLEILDILVRADIKQSLAMIDVITVLLFARQEHVKIAARLIRSQIACLRGIGAVDIQDDEFLVAGAAARNGIQLIFFFVNRIVPGSAQRVPPKMIGAFGNRVFRSQEQGLVVGSPFERRYALGSVGKRLASAQIFHVQGVLPVTGDVSGVRQKIRIVADLETAQAEERVPFRGLVAVQQHFFRRVHAAFAPALDGILLAFFGARIVKIAIAAGGHREVSLLDAAQHFRIQRLFKRLQTFGHRVGVGVLGLQILDHRRIGFVAQPKVVVDHSGSMPLFAVLNAVSDRWRVGRATQDDPAQAEDKYCSDFGAIAFHRTLLY